MLASRRNERKSVRGIGPAQEQLVNQENGRFMAVNSPCHGYERSCVFDSPEKKRVNHESKMPPAGEEVERSGRGEAVEEKLDFENGLSLTDKAVKFW